MLSIENLHKIYPNGHEALSGITLEIPDGVLGLLGPNGAGKSTLMEILAAQIGFERGKVLLDGRINLRHSPQRWRRQLGYLPQNFDFPAQATGREVLWEAAALMGIGARRIRPRIEQLLEEVNLLADANRRASTYSRGMKQRLGLAMTLLHEPRLLLLDEPTAGLDPVERVTFRQLLAEVAATRIVVLSTHIVGDIERCCSRVAVIVGGQIAFNGSTGELARRAEGKVWVRQASEQAMNEAMAAGTVVRADPAESGVTLRELSAERPGPEAQRAPPTLEDGYLLALSQAGLSPLASTSASSR